MWSLVPVAEKHHVNPRNGETLGVTITLKGQLRSRGGVIRESPTLDGTSKNRLQILMLSKSRGLSHSVTKAHCQRSQRTVKGDKI